VSSEVLCPVNRPVTTLDCVLLKDDKGNLQYTEYTSWKNANCLVRLRYRVYI
jgi:hypothetical protein